MTLETLFYALGIVYILASIAVMLAILIVAWITYRKIKQTQKDLTDKIKTTLSFPQASLRVLKDNYPALITGAVTWAGKNIFKRRK